MYAVNEDRAAMRDAPAVRCVCGHWAAVHVDRGGSHVCTAARCDCPDFLGSTR